MCYEYEVVDTIGKEGLKQLQRHCRNSRLYIPQTMHADHTIAQILGLEAAKKLSAEFAGCILNISRSLLLRERNERIIEERIVGSPPEIVAAKYGLTARSIRKITQGMKLQRARPRFGLRARHLRKVLQGPHDHERTGQQAKSHG